MSAPAEMTVQRTDLNPCTIKLEVVCTADQVEKGFDRAIREFAKKVRVPGFRPGSAPRSMVEQMIPEQDLVSSAVDQTIRSALKSALDRTELVPQDAPAVTVTKFERTPPALEFEVKVPLAAKVKVGEYKGLKASRPTPEVEPGEVLRQIEELRQRASTRQAVTGRGIQEGDVAVANIRPDGETGEGKTFMVIAGQTFAGLDAALTGMEPEQIRHAELDFPANFQDKDWAGKKLACSITVRSVSSVHVPEVDEEFAKSLNTESVADLETRVREGIVEAKRRMGEEIVNEQLLDALMAASEVEVPDTTWERVASRRLNEMAAYLQREGKTLEDHAQANGMTLEELAAAQMAEAKTHVQRATLVREIFLSEDMKITDQEANATFLQIAQENQVTQEELPKWAKENGAALREEIVFRTMFGKVIGLLREHATVTDVPPSELGLGAGAPAPAPAAKRGGKKKAQP